MIIKGILAVSVSFLLLNISFVVMEYGLRMQLDRGEVKKYYYLQDLPEEVKSDSSILSDEEEFIYEDVEFDKRIARLKEELINDNFKDVKPHEATEGEVGAEGIYNLPHDVINFHGGSVDEEISL